MLLIDLVDYKNCDITRFKVFQYLLYCKSFNNCVNNCIVYGLLSVWYYV